MILIHAFLVFMTKRRTFTKQFKIYTIIGYDQKEKTMKRKSRIIISSIILSLTLQGCSLWHAKWGPDKPHISYVKLEDEKNNPIGTLYVWNPDDTGAFISNKGDACLQVAEIFKTQKAELEAAIKMGALLEKAENIDTSLKQVIEETATKLSDKDAAATFLSIAMFNICMYEMNGALDKDQVTEITKHAITKAAEIATTKVTKTENDLNP